MQALWGERRRIGLWRRLWLALMEAQQELGLDIPDRALAELRAHLDDADPERAAEHEKRLRHDVMAHIHHLGEQAPAARAYLHLGATSAYVTDNTDLVLMREGLELLLGRLAAVLVALAKLARRDRAVPCLAYTHFQPAQLTTVGKRVTLWMQDFALDADELLHRHETLQFRGVKGTTGTQASFLELFDGEDEKVRELDARVARKMGFARVFAVTGQTYTRKLDAQVLAALSGVAASAAKFAAVGLHGKRGAEPEAVDHTLLLEVDRELVLAARRLMAAEQLGDLLGQEAHGDEPVLTAVREKDVGERRRQDRAEAVLAERPDRVLPRRAAAEVLPGEKDARAPGAGAVELEIRIRAAVGPKAPVVEQGRSEPRALHPLQKLLRNDLVGIDVGARQGRQPTGVTHEGLRHRAAGSLPQLRTSTIRPATAAAAAMGGLIRWVRPPRPWRPSKLRFDVEAQRSPLCSTSGFIPRHIEHPALRHSNPASLNTRSSPSFSAWAFTCCDPGTTIARTPVATCRPRTVRAAARRSSMRAFVHDPRNTRSIGSPSSGVPGASPMYSSARVTARRSASVGKSAGLGTRPVTALP